MGQIITVGLDLAKNEFQTHGADGVGLVVRSAKPRFTVYVPPGLGLWEHAFAASHPWWAADADWNRGRPVALIRAMQRLTLLGILVGMALSAHAASADLMQACAEEVRAYCADVDRGRGRVSACLASHRDKLGSACLPEVRAVAQSWMVPENVRKMFNQDFSAELPSTCKSAAARLCPNVEQGGGRIFACLYARTQQVGGACQADAEAVVEAN